MSNSLKPAVVVKHHGASSAILRQGKGAGCSAICINRSESVEVEDKAAVLKWELCGTFACGLLDAWSSCILT